MAKELYVGHLPYEATNDDLRRMFSVAGTVTSVHIITDPVSGKSKGCGYVRMSSEAELQEAIDCLDGALMENLTITVSIARPQKPEPPGQQPGKPRKPGGSRKPATPSRPEAAQKKSRSAKPAAARTTETPRKTEASRKPATGPKPHLATPRKPTGGRRTPAGRN